MDNWIIDTIGMLGTALVVLAYCLLQLEKTDAKSLSFNITNLLGAILLLFSLCFHFNLGSFVIEVFWIIASLIGLWKYWCRHNTASQSNSS